MNAFKVTVIGPAGSGKTTFVERVWKGKKWNEIKTIPTTGYEFTEKPIKLGNISISALDLGGQQMLLENWLSKNGEFEFKAFKDASAILIVLDFSTVYKRWQLYDKSPATKQALIKLEDDAKELITRAIASAARQNINGHRIKVAIMFNKWDLIEDHEFFQELKAEFKKFMIPFVEKMRINFKGIYRSSNKLERYTPKSAVKAILPHSEAIMKIFENFIKRFTTHDAEHVYFSTLNNDFLEVESFQFPVAEEHDYQSIIIPLHKTMYYSFHLPDLYKKLAYHHDGLSVKFQSVSHELTINHLTYTTQLIRLNDDFLLFILADIPDAYLVKTLCAKLRKAMKIQDAIYL